MTLGPSCPLVLGVVGGVGAGKSTVAALFADLGASVLSADEIAHEVIQTPEVKDELRSWLGDEVFTEKGDVDRQAVARRVFADRGELQHLESLLHPEVRRRILAEVRSFRESGSGLLVLDVPLLVESPLRDLCDEILYVEATAAERRRRTRARGWEEAELARREAHQSPIDEKRRLASASIDNSGPFEETERRVRELYGQLSSRSLRKDVKREET